MGRYAYSKEEKERNKVMYYQHRQLCDMQQQSHEMRAQLEQRISESESLLQSLGYSLPDSSRQTLPEVQNRKHKQAFVESWEDIVRQAEAAVPFEAGLEDLLSQDEFEKAYRELDTISREFDSCTGLRGVDAAFIAVAAALQTVRWVLMPEIGGTFDAAERMTAKEGDALVKKLKQEFVEKHSGWDTEKKHQGRRLRQEEKTWKEIIFSGVPYDVTAGSKELGLHLEGRYHRYKTLGHDPVLGWIFGTANILTDTMTLNPMLSYRVKKGKLLNETLLLPQLFAETVQRVRSSEHLLPAAVFRQALHYKSDMYTKTGLPVPLLGAFHESLAGKLYKSQYDFLCFVHDSKIEGTSALLSVLIDMLASFVHGLYYRPECDGSRDLFELRTRKILLVSNALAASGNIAVSFLAKNAKLLDIGGLLVTAAGLYRDARFLARAKQKFIQEASDREMQQILSDADRLYAVF